MDRGYERQYAGDGAQTEVVGGGSNSDLCSACPPFILALQVKHWGSKIDTERTFTHPGKNVVIDSREIPEGQSPGVPFC